LDVLQVGDRLAIPRRYLEPLTQWLRTRELGFSQRAMSAARGTAYGGTSHFRFAPSRAMLGNYADILGVGDLQAIADSDLFWDDVHSIEPDGEEYVYDMTVPGHTTSLRMGSLRTTHWSRMPTWCCSFIATRSTTP